MAKITALTALAAALTDTDVFSGVDVSDTTDDPAGSSRKIPGSVIKAYASPPASVTVAGIAEYATAAELRSKTANKTLTPDLFYAAGAEVTLTDDVTIAVDFDTFINGVVTLAGNRTLGNPTNVTDGQSGYIRVVQDGTPPRTLAFGTNYEFASGAAPVMSTGAADEDMLLYQVISATRILITSVLNIS